MPMPPVLHDLLSATGPSGVEGNAAAVWRQAAGRFAAVETDHHGNSYARVPGTGGGRSVAVFGHVDEIGLMVHHIDDDGYLWFAQVGGWDPIILVGQRLTVLTDRGPIPGVVGKKPIHLMKEDDRKQVPKLKDLHIDIGAKDGDDARSLVRIGDTAVIDAQPVEYPNGRVVSKAMDNRLGAFVAYESARLVHEAGGAPGEFIGIATVQEEVGLYGAMTAAHRVRPDVAIAVDVTFASDQPGVEAREIGKHELGSGPAIERGTTLHPAVSRGLIDAAEAAGIAYTIATSQRGTGTDADATHTSRAGIPTGLVGIPLRYMHSPVEMVQLSDLEAAAQLVAQYALRLAADATFER